MGTDATVSGRRNDASVKRLIEMARRNMAHVKAGTVDQEPAVHRVPAASYYDPERARLETERIFKRLPLTIGFSAELREPGAYQALEAAGVPLLLSRGADREIRAFVNMCSHRGAIIAKEGVGRARRFMCPYHAWTYDQRGELVSMLDAEDFGAVDRSCLGLTPLPVAERAGLIFVVLTPGAPLDLDAFLCGYGELLQHLHLDACHVVGRQSIPGPNWKVAYDGYLDFYHLPVLHRESFGKDMPNKALYDSWGPHTRVSMPTPSLLRLADVPEDEWEIAELIPGVWTIFPHISIATFDAGGPVYMVSQLFPGPSADESVTVQNFISPVDLDADRVEGLMKFLKHVVADEDYYTGRRIQRSIKTGAKTEILFGRNEGGGQRYHRWVEALVQAADEDLPALFAAGLEQHRSAE